MARALFTIGYEDKTVQEFLDALGAAGVELLIDVRAIVASRRVRSARPLAGQRGRRSR